MSLDFGIGKDGAGRAVVSASFVLARAPSPPDRLSSLVTHATVALDLVATAQDVVLARTRATALLANGPARAVATGPFGQVSLSFTGQDDEAGELLRCLVERSGGPTLRMEAMTAPGPGVTRRVSIQLGRLWELLSDRLGDSRQVRRVELERHLGDLVESGAVGLVETPTSQAARAAVVDVVVRRAVGVLVPQESLVPPPPGEETYRLTDRPPGDMSITAMVTVPGGPGAVLVSEKTLGDLVAEAGADPASVVSLVTTAGGRLTGLVPSRRLSARAGPSDRLLMVQAAGRLQPLVLAAGGSQDRPVVASALRPDVHVAIANSLPLAVFTPDEQQQPGPVVGAEHPAYWPDRVDGSFWYVPELTFLAPQANQAPADSPFLFDVTPTGHGLDGSAGLEATVTLTIGTRMPDDVRAAWEAAGSPTVKPVASEDLTVQLGVPFRDQNGTAQIQFHLAESASPSADYGTDTGRLVAVFRLADQWARMAYGAMSTPGFQAEPARVVVTAGYHGWVHKGGFFPVVQPDKIAVVLKPEAQVLAALRPPALRAAPGEPGTNEPQPRWNVGIAASQVGALAKAGITVEPRLNANVALIAAWNRGRYEWTRFNAASSVPALVPCADHGNLYRRVVAGEEPVGVGCQDVLKLGQAEFRTHEPITVAAARGYGKVLRSLTRPGHYVLVPDRYLAGRFGSGDGDRAYDPQLLLTSVLDDETAALRAVLAATLEADVPPAVRTAIVDELHARSPEVTLDLPWAAGLTQQVSLAVPGHGDVQCVPTPTGFTIMLTLDVSDFLVVKAMLETAGLIGGAVLTLPDRVTVSSTLELSLRHVTGPYDGGPVSLTRDNGRVELTNRIGSRVSVTSLRAAGGSEIAVGKVLATGESVSVSAARPDHGEYDVVSVVEAGHDTLDEVRVYVEDLEVEIVVVLAGNLGSAVALEVATTFQGHSETDPVVLTATHKQESRRFLLPLTAYVADPALQLVSTAVAADGTRTSGAPLEWALRRQGAVIPVTVPSPDA